MSVEFTRPEGVAVDGLLAPVCRGPREQLLVCPILVLVQQ
jgi:hypothetical protein